MSEKYKEEMDVLYWFVHHMMKEGYSVDEAHKIWKIYKTSISALTESQSVRAKKAKRKPCACQIGTCYRVALNKKDYYCIDEKTKGDLADR